MKARICELCDQEASLYCSSDSAFLCSVCDERVHQANFLVARHVRQSLCSSCKGLIEDCNLQSLCSSCWLETFHGDSGALSSSSEASLACISSIESLSRTATVNSRFETRKLESSVMEVSGKLSNIPARFSATKANKVNVRRARERTLTSVDVKAEGGFKNWCRKLELNGDCTTTVVSLASSALRFCLGRLAAGVPLRVCMAASFWFGLKFCGNRSVSTCQNLRGVEEVSRVPAKLILAIEAKLGRELRIRRARYSDDLEEGWAEC